MDRSIEMSWIGQVDIAEEMSRNYVARQGQEGNSMKNRGGDWELAYNVTVEMQLLTNVVVTATQASVKSLCWTEEVWLYLVDNKKPLMDLKPGENMII